MAMKLYRLLLALTLLFATADTVSAASLTSRYASVANYYGNDPVFSSSFGMRRRATTSQRGRRRLPLSLSPSIDDTLLASITRDRRDDRRQQAEDRSRDRKRRPARKSPDSIADDVFASQHGQPQITYQDLSPFGKLVAGTVEVCIATVTEYLTGFSGGYALGVVTDLPRLLFRSVQNSEQQQEQMRRTIWQEISGRTARLNGKSMKWARSWGELSAVFGGCRVAVRVLRNGKDDEWSSVLSSMAAGAFLARKDGPQAMIRGAATYGMMIYLLSGNAFRRGKPFRYTEQPLEF